MTPVPIPKLLVFTLFLLFIAASAPCNPLDEADRLFAEKKYQEGVRILKRAFAEKRLADEERFRAGLALAEFYADQAGDYPRAVKLGRNVLLNRKISVDPSLKTRAGILLNQWIEQEKNWKALNRELRQMKVAALKRESLTHASRAREMDRNITRLKSILREYPGFYRSHEVYYVLGLTRLMQERPYAAWKAFGRALDLKPAMDLGQPVSRLVMASGLLWKKGFSRIAACFILGGGLAALCGLWIFSRPFRWLRATHLLAGSAVVLIWIVFFHLSVNRPQDLGHAEDLINSEGVYPVPVYIHLEKGSPGSGSLDYLFYYGLTAVTGIFLFSAAIGGIRNRIVATGLGCLFSLAFSASLAVLFILNHCDTGTDIYPGNFQLSDIPRAGLAFPVSDPEPYLLTNPLYYRGLDLSQIDDPELIRWLQAFSRIRIPTEK